MASNPYKNKVIYDGTVLIDLSSDTVSPENLMEGYTAHDASGAPITGTMSGGVVIISDTTDSHGGTIREITATDAVTLTTKTTTPSEYQQVIIGDAPLGEANGTENPNARTSGGSTTKYITITPNPSLIIQYDSYRVVGSINVIDGNGVLESYTVDETVTYSASQTDLVVNDSNAYCSRVTFAMASSVQCVVRFYFQKTGWYGFVVRLQMCELQPTIDGLSKVVVNSVPDTFYSPTQIRNFIERNSSLTKIKLPDGITKIGKSAFMGCSGITEMDIPNTVTFIDESAFDGCRYMAMSSLPSTITTIGDYAFQTCESITFTSLPSGLRSLGSYAFGGCSALALTSLPSGVTTINSYTFYGCTSLALSGSLGTSITAIKSYAFRTCTGITITSLPNTVTSIESCAFQYCTGIINLTCDGTIKTLGSSAFNGSSSYLMQLKTVRFPYMALTSNISTVFGNSTAANACQQLELADIGSTTGIAANAFANCYKLQTLILRKTSAVCTLASTSAFTNTPMQGYNSLTGTIYVPNDLIASYKTASNWSTLYNNGTIDFVKIEGSAYELE